MSRFQNGILLGLHPMAPEGSYKDGVNRSRKRHSRNKASRRMEYFNAYSLVNQVHPHGIPELIHESSEEYGALNVKVRVSNIHLNLVTFL